ncbi:MAG TPA: hypothetical protein VLH09_05750 [Bryobacteraceae bacterium]|nr:hypothetical protein [Bryobacteraceae bacterium]
MKFAALVALLLAAMMPAAEQPTAKVPRTSLAPLESAFDARMTRPGQDDPFDLLGNTRGVYLPGYGVVLTAEVNLVTTPPITPFRPAVIKEDAANLRRRKLAKLEVLKKAMRELMASTASSLGSLPPGEQVAVAVTLFYYSWEQRAGLPSQILMQAPRAALLGGAGPSLDAALRIEEF